jgi:hypothetical protein
MVGAGALSMKKAEQRAYQGDGDGEEQHGNGENDPDRLQRRDDGQ